MDCSIVGPLKLPSVTCGEFFSYLFIFLSFFTILYIFSHVEARHRSQKAVPTSARALTHSRQHHTHKHKRVHGRALVHRAHRCTPMEKHLHPRNSHTKACEGRAESKRTCCRFIASTREGGEDVVEGLWGGAAVRRPLIGLRGCIKLHLHNIESTKSLPNKSQWEDPSAGGLH